MSSENVYIIAEIGQAHDGSLGILHSFIDALKGSEIDALKFQIHIAEAESSIHEPFRVKFSYEDETRFDYWKRMEFSKDQWLGVKEHCEEAGFEFLASPFSLAAVDLLEEIGVDRYKIGSGEVSNFLMLEKIGKTGKPVILSSGMSSFSELDRTVDFMKKFNSEISILQCTTSYPTPAEKTGLNVIPKIIERYNVTSGLSDHSGTIYPSIAAVALGAKILEVHVTFDKRMFGPDSSSSLSIEEIKKMAEGVRFIEKSMNNPINKDDNSQFSELKSIFEKSLSVNKDLEQGHILTFEDLESKKPAGQGIPTNKFQEVLGKKINKELKTYSFLKPTDLID